MIHDMEGNPFTEGCKFVKPYTLGRSPFLEIRIASLRGGRLYGGDSKVAIQHPERCLVL